MIGASAVDPWTGAQVRLALGCDVVAALAVGVAAFGAGGGSLSNEVLWLNVAVLGLVLVVVVNGSLLLFARRAIGRRRLQLLPDAVEKAAPARQGSTPGWWWLPGTSRAHLAGCQMIAGKPAEVIAVDQVRANRLQRCEMCS